MGGWLENSKKYSMIVSSLQSATGFSDWHSVHGELVLYATQFESISHSDKADSNKKYIHPVEKYGSEKVKSQLTTIFNNVGQSDYGKGIGDLRNEIAHVGKPQVLLSKLSLGDMVSISQYLHVTIIGYILTLLGINKNIINNYQDKYTPPIQ